ncbi:MAG: 5-formyltetrahydrofolate cyclo-ligase [Lachnospiraceae bacterium]|nr:5-formyltetrahydrofolate cyclo-ligase [Lachnospiraceae bacterium]
MERKQQIRKVLKQKRDSLTKEQARKLSAEICGHIQCHQWFQQAETVCFYYPLGKEANLLSLAERALAQGKKAAFPKVNGKEMDFYQTASLKEFQEGCFHVMEPVGKRKIYEKDALVLVPGLGFDTFGGRIGYGGGYYDRYFSRHPHSYKLGISYAGQLLETLCREPHDILMDGVVTEEGVFLRKKELL